MFGHQVKRTALGVFTAAGLTLAGLAGAMAAPEINQPAPGFTGVDSNGESFSLSDIDGQKVILEWTNHDCPYVRKHYETDNMQALQRDAAEQGIYWVTIISSAPGEQGHVSPDMANELTETRDAAPSRVILDEEGVIGRLYNAKTTPQMFVIDEGKIVRYMGAIDDKPTSRKSSVDDAKNYVRVALKQIADGEAVSDPVTKPYGCSVKYAK